MTRTEIRYNLMLYKKGVENSTTDEIIKTYTPILKENGLSFDDFYDIWDIDKDDVLSIVSGHVLIKYKAEHETEQTKATKSIAKDVKKSKTKGSR